MTKRMTIVLATAAFLLAGTVGSGASLRKASADAEVDISVFYRSLAPYGEWVQIDPYGWAWVPENVEYGWRPYTAGTWSWVEPYGWTWISEEPWGWATYHYGRWTYVDDYGWAWVPGSAWAPAWVAFRYTDPWVGWAPLPPGASWRFDSGFDIAGLNVDVSVGTYAWSFVPLRYFAEPDLRSRVLVTAYNPYLVQRTQWSTRYAAIDGGLSNRSIDIAVVEKARGTPVTRRRLQEAASLDKGSGSRVEGDAVVFYRPRIAAKAAAATPVPQVRGDGKPLPPVDLNAWTAARQTALKAHLDAQRKALEEQNAALPKPGVGPDDDAAKRREAGIKALEDERKRLEALLEKQRKRREKEQQQPPLPQPPPPPPPPPPAMGDDGHGKKDDDGHGMK